MCKPHRPVDAPGTNAVDGCAVSRTVAEMSRVDGLPLGSAGGSCRAVMRWSDGSEAAALRWYRDEIYIGAAELIGGTREQPRSLQFRRDRDWLRS